MSIELRVHFDDRLLAQRMQIMGRKLRDPRPLLLRFHAYMRRRTIQTFKRLAHGGTFRGVTWKPFAVQYTRRTDGVTVPAHGGVPRLRGRGMVKGRLRPSGKRVTSRSNLLRDRGKVFQRAGMAKSFEDGGNTIVMGTQVRHAHFQQVTLDRKFLFYQIPQNLDWFADEAVDHLEEAS